MKISKKLLSLILALLVLIGTVSVVAVGTSTVSAATGDVFYFEKPADWGDDIYVYWWSGAGAPSWPGVKMTKESDTVYSFTATSDFTNFNINDGGEGNTPTPHQTVDLKFPQSGKLGVVGASAGKNGFGNECWNLTWTDLNGIGVSVFASVEDCEFVDSLEVVLKVVEASKGTYSINGSKEVEFLNGEKIIIGADGKAGDSFVLTLKAGEGTDAVSKTYTYTKTDSPVGASIVYFDNSKFNWADVYCYAYGAKENGEWPGQKMSYDSKSGLYYLTFGKAYTSESIIFNDGIDGDVEGSEQYPEAGGLDLKVGQCKLLSADLHWVDYGKPDSKPYGFAYISDGAKFNADALNVDIDLKNATKGSYSVDGGAEFEYTERTTIAVGQGKIGNSEVTLTLRAVNDDGVTTETVYKYYKSFTPSKTTFRSPSDGSTTAAVGGNYSTNPNMQLGKYSNSITVDGDVSDWDSSMIIAQGVANDDPRVYMPSAMHEQPWDDYALYCAWDDDNLYFMWEMVNTTYIVSPGDNFAASKEANPWRNSIPMYIALSIDPEKHATGKAIGTTKTGATYTNPFVWGCDNGVAKDGGVGFTTNIDTLIAFDSNNSNGGASIFKADTLDTDGTYLFNYDTRIPIGVKSFEAQDNQNGFKIKHSNDTKSETLYGVNGAKGTRTLGDNYDMNSNWVDFFDIGYKKEYGFIYEVAIPLSNLGIDRSYIETEGIGAMQILTYGTSGMDSLPFDPSMLDAANVEYSYDPSTSHEKEDVDNITVPLARIGALLKDTVITEAPLELNFGTDKSSAQCVDTELNLKAEVYGTDESYKVVFSVDGKELASNGETARWTPTKIGTYKLSAKVTTASGKTVEKSLDFAVGEVVEVIIPPETEPTEPITPVNPTVPVKPSTPADSTDPSEATSSTEASGVETTVDPSEGASDATTTGGADASGTTSETGEGTAPSKPVTDGILGDADNNGKINIKDATLIQKHAAMILEIPQGQIKLADVNSDEKLNVRDATAIQKFIANMKIDYPIGKPVA